MCVPLLRWPVPAPRFLLVPLFALLPALTVQAADTGTRLNLDTGAAIAKAAAVGPSRAQAAPITHNDGPPLSLEAATKLAVSRAPRVRAGRFQVEAARQDAVRAGRLPDPRLVGGINNLTVTGPQAFDAAADMMTMRQIGVSQDIPSHAEREAQKQVAQAGVQVASADEVNLRLSTQRAAASAWVALWAAQQERQLLTELRGQYALAVTLSKARLSGGTGTAAAALATRANAEQLENRLDAADADVEGAHATLRRWLGPAADRPLGRHPDFSTLRVPLARLDAEVDRLGPLLRWGPLENKADAAVALARAGKHPNWSVSLMYGQRIRLPDMLGIEVGVSLPLFPGNRQDRNISARVANRAAVRAQREEAIRAERVAIAQGIATWQGLDRQITRYRTKLLPLAADRSRAALASYRGGDSLQPWLDARDAEIATRVAYANALEAWGKAWVALAYLLPDQNTVELPQ